MRKMLTFIIVFLNFIFGCTKEEPDIKRVVIPEVHDVLFGDPYILLHDSTYYLYGTSSDNGIEVYYSTDLLHWNGPGGASGGFALHKDDVWGDKWFWAPEVYFFNNKFYMFFSVEEHIAVAVSDDPLGPFVQQNQEPLLTTKAIDTHLFIDDDGKKYLYYVAFTDGNVIWMAEMTDDLLQIKPGTKRECFGVSEAWEATNSAPVAKVCEGPFMLKRDGVYYLFYSANHFESPDYAMGYASAPTPIGPWKKYAGNPVLKPSAEYKGTGHGALFTTTKDELVLVYHAHQSLTAVNPRKVLFNYCKYYQATPDKEAYFEVLDPVIVPKR